MYYNHTNLLLYKIIYLILNPKNKYFQLTFNFS